MCDILDLLVDGSKGMSLGQVAEVTELPKNTVFRYLATLEGRRYVERDEYGLYGPGSAFLPFLWHQVELLTRRARPRLEQVRDMVGETVNLGVLGGEGVTYLDIVESPRSVRAGKPELVAAMGFTRLR